MLIVYNFMYENSRFMNLTLKMTVKVNEETEIAPSIVIIRFCKNYFPKMVTVQQQ